MANDRVHVMSSSVAPSSDRIVCNCFSVSESAIRLYFEDQLATIDGFLAETGATTKCSACRMDFELVLESIRTQVAIAPVARRAPPKVEGNLRYDYVDSGFLINAGGISTTLRIDNAPNAFDPASRDALTDFRWWLKILDESGNVCSSRTGHVAVGSSLTIDLSDDPHCPSLGWFWIWLDSLRGGYFGSTRPQYGLLGQGWAATVHTQPHADACFRKSVLVQPGPQGFNFLVSIINGDCRVKTNCEIVMTPADGGREERRSLEIPANGSCLTGMQELFGEGCEHLGTATLSVLSDRPTRKHIIKVQPNGHYSIDHFPNAK